MSAPPLTQPSPDASSAAGQAVAGQAEAPRPRRRMTPAEGRRLWLRNIGAESGYDDAPADPSGLGPARRTRMFGRLRSAAGKLTALLVAVPLAWLMHAGLLALRGPGEAFERGDPLPPSHQDAFADVAALTPWPHAGDWPMVGHDPHHAGASPADFASADLVKAWDDPFVGDRTRVWDIRSATPVWTPAVVGRIPLPDGTVVPMVIAGCYDRSLYALDARTGTLRWRYSLTDGFFRSAPALAMVDLTVRTTVLVDAKADQSKTSAPPPPAPATPVGGSRRTVPLVVFAASDRSVVALDARDGTVRWQLQTRAWTQSTAEAACSSVTTARLFGRTVVLAGVWNAERSGLDNAQDGELLALDARDGSVLWRVRLGTAPATTPAVAVVRGRPCVVVATEDGVIRALDARNGSKLWERTLHQELRSSPALALTPAGVPVALIGTRFHSVYALDVVAGRKLWMFQSDYWVDATPAVVPGDRARSEDDPGTAPAAEAPDALGGNANGDPDAGPDRGPLVVVGSYGSTLHALPLEAERKPVPAWRLEGRGEFRSNPVVARLRGRPVVFVAGFDNTLLMLDPRGTPVGDGARPRPGAGSAATKVQPSGEGSPVPDRGGGAVASDGKSGGPLELWRFQGGALLYSHEFQGDALWPGPSVADWGEGARVFLPGIDGRMYAFKSRPKP